MLLSALKLFIPLISLSGGQVDTKQTPSRLFPSRSARQIRSVRGCAWGSVHRIRFLFHGNSCTVCGQPVGATRPLSESTCSGGVETCEELNDERASTTHHHFHLCVAAKSSQLENRKHKAVERRPVETMQTPAASAEADSSDFKPLTREWGQPTLTV